MGNKIKALVDWNKHLLQYYQQIYTYTVHQLWSSRIIILSQYLQNKVFKTEFWYKHSRSAHWVRNLCKYTFLIHSRVEKQKRRQYFLNDVSKKILPAFSKLKINWKYLNNIFTDSKEDLYTVMYFYKYTNLNAYVGNLKK